MPYYLVTTDGKHIPKIKGPYLTELKAEDRKNRFEEMGLIVYGPHHSMYSKSSPELARQLKENIASEAPGHISSGNFSKGG